MLVNLLLRPLKNCKKILKNQTTFQKIKQNQPLISNLCNLCQVKSLV